MEEGRAMAAKVFELAPEALVLGLDSAGQPLAALRLPGPNRRTMTRGLAQGRQVVELAGRVSLASPPAAEDQAGKRVIRGLSLARVISNSAYMLQAIAFPMMAMAAVGAPSFAAIGVAVSAAGILLAFANGALADKLSPRSIMVGGSVLAAGAAAAMASAAAAGALNLWTLGGLAVALNGLLQAVVVGESSVAVQAVHGDPKRIQAVVSRFDLIFSAAGVAASLAGGFAVAAIGPAWAFAIFAAAQLAAGFVYFRTVPGADVLLPPGTASPSPASGPGLGETFSILRRSPYLLTLLGLVLAAAALIFPLQATLLPMIVQGPLKGSAALLGLVNAAIYAGILAGSVFNSLWSERFDNATLLKAGSLAFAGLGILLAAPFSVAVLLGTVAAIFLLQTVGFNVLRSLYLGRAQQAHPRHLGRLISLFSAGFGLAMASGTWLAGQAMAWLGYPGMLYLLAVPFGLAAILYAFAPYLLNKAESRSSRSAKQ